MLNSQLVPVPQSWTTPNAYQWIGTSTLLTATGSSPTYKSFLTIEQNLCTDACTGSGLYGSDATGTFQCPYDSLVTPRADSASRKPLTDFSASDSLPVLYTSQAPSANQNKAKNRDLDFFPDLKLFPAVAGAAVPIFNIPELQALVTNVTAGSALILGRQTVKKIFAGEITVSHFILKLLFVMFMFGNFSFFFLRVLIHISYYLCCYVSNDRCGMIRSFLQTTTLQRILKHPLRYKPR